MPEQPPRPSEQEIRRMLDRVQEIGRGIHNRNLIEELIQQREGEDELDRS
jgi:hypothetical protein